MDDLLSTDELVEQLTSESLAGRMVLLVGEDPEAVSERLGLSVEALVDFGVELLRFDALQFHSAETLLAQLADLLGIDNEHVMVGLKVRGQTDNPLLLVVDNAECLAADARNLLRRLATETESGLGVIFGGEPDAEQALLQAGIPLSLILESADVVEPEVTPSLTGNRSEREVRGSNRVAAGVAIPWRHLAAVAGLSLLVVLFWLGTDKEPAGEDIRALTLPPSPLETITAETTEKQPMVESDAITESSLEPKNTEADSAAVAEPVERKPVEMSVEAKAKNQQTETAKEINKPQQTVTEPEVQAAVKPVAKPVVQPVVKPIPKPAAKPASTTPALTGMAAELAYRNEDWLLAQSGERWMLQVATANSEDAGRAMLDRLGREHSAYYRARRNGKVVFVVLAGSWGTRDQALVGRDRLASEFRQLGPFPREMRAIHSEIIAVR